MFVHSGLWNKYAVLQQLKHVIFIHSFLIPTYSWVQGHGPYCILFSNAFNLKSLWILQQGGVSVMAGQWHTLSIMSLWTCKAIKSLSGQVKCNKMAVLDILQMDRGDKYINTYICKMFHLKGWVLGYCEDAEHSSVSVGCKRKVRWWCKGGQQDSASPFRRVSVSKQALTDWSIVKVSCRTVQMCPHCTRVQYVNIFGLSTVHINNNSSVPIWSSRTSPCGAARGHN